MAEYVLPPWLRVSAVDKGILGNTAEFSSPLNGAVRTYGRPGDRLRFDVRVENASNRTTVAERAYYEGLIAAIRSKANRVWMVPPGYAGPRGSFPAAELFSNADFSNGTTGWTGANATLSVSNQVLRIKAPDSFPGPAAVPQAGGTESGGVAYAPFSIRQLTVQGKGSIGSSGPFIASGGLSVSDYGAFGLRTATLVVPSTSIDGILVGGINTSGYGAGDYVDVPYASLARCFLIDNGPNLLLRSDEFDNATWTKTGASATANSAVAPNGATVADTLSEDGSTGQHVASQAVTVSSAAADYSFGVAILAAGRSFAAIEWTVSGGAASTFIDLSTGAVSNTGASGTLTNGRATSTNLGSGWYWVTMTARKTGTETSITARVYAATSTSVVNYAGSSAAALYLWRATLAQSGVPTRPIETTTTASSGTSQTGSGLYVKGLPASTNGLLLPGDYVQIGSQLEMVTASLDSDAAGLGYLQLSRPQRTAPADNAPVIVHQPMGRFLFADSDVNWSLRPGLFSDFTIPLVEDVT